MSVKVLYFFENNGMVVYALPAHSSGKPQPPDVVMFSIYKKAINKALCDTADRVGSKECSVFYFWSILRPVYHECFTGDNIKA